MAIVKVVTAPPAVLLQRVFCEFLFSMITKMKWLWHSLGKDVFICLPTSNWGVHLLPECAVHLGLPPPVCPWWYTQWTMIHIWLHSYYCQSLRWAWDLMFYYNCHLTNVDCHCQLWGSGSKLVKVGRQLTPYKIPNGSWEWVGLYWNNILTNNKNLTCSTSCSWGKLLRIHSTWHSFSSGE